MDYIVAIPSFNRTEKFKAKTLKLLKDYNIDFNNVWLFLENNEQKEMYEGLVKNVVVTNTIGIGKKRNFMRRWFRANDWVKNVLCLDDDLDSIGMVQNGVGTKVPNLHKFVVECFQRTEELGLCIWGVCPYDNTFYMKEGSESQNLKYIIGACFGLIVDRKRQLLQTEYNQYEDMEFSIKHFRRDGGVQRYNSVYIKTKYFGDGGINSSYGGFANRQKDMEDAGKRFVLQYPKFCRLVRKKIGYDVRLNHKAKPTD